MRKYQAATIWWAKEDVHAYQCSCVPVRSYGLVPFRVEKLKIEDWRIRLPVQIERQLYRNVANTCCNVLGDENMTGAIKKEKKKESAFRNSYSSAVVDPQHSRLIRNSSWKRCFNAGLAISDCFYMAKLYLKHRKLRNSRYKSIYWQPRRLDCHIIIHKQYRHKIKRLQLSKDTVPNHRVFT